MNQSVVSKCGNSYKLRFVCKMMWELLQITILRTNSKIVGTTTFRNFFSHRTHVKYNTQFNDVHSAQENPP
ncbi:hypothetical protein LIL_12331 [Leptospira interrogans serovar Linhai str. 56609]|nr:hypothetical protein LIL_12331 [Leptospira interrogans serovar Linhai str. 56609]KWV26273.1 hypothetical protein LA733_0799 [Leptospira interrogans]KWV28674.1 hypothetical protein LA702_0683 [Leptospira interrogans]